MNSYSHWERHPATIVLVIAFGVYLWLSAIRVRRNFERIGSRKLLRVPFVLPELIPPVLLAIAISIGFILGINASGLDVLASAVAIALYCRSGAP